MNPEFEELPEKIKIGFADWDLVVESEAPKELEDVHVFGLCHKHKHTIVFYEGYDEVQNRNTILHEVLHAVWYSLGMEEPASEEHVVTALSNGLMMVLRDNPEFAVWFINHLCGSADDA